MISKSITRQGFRRKAFKVLCGNKKMGERHRSVIVAGVKSLIYDAMGTTANIFTKVRG
jgi:hypothetical protein